MASVLFGYMYLEFGYPGVGVVFVLSTMYYMYKVYIEIVEIHR